MGPKGLTVSALGQQQPVQTAKTFNARNGGPTRREDIFLSSILHRRETPHRVHLFKAELRHIHADYTLQAHQST